MAEISTAAISGSLKVGLQVVSNYKRPVLEIYHEFCNKFGPAFEHDVPVGMGDGKSYKITGRHQEIYISFSLVNIGGVRAEDIEITIEGDLKINRQGVGFGGAFNQPIPQFAPGQIHFLFRLDQFDLSNISDDGRMGGLKKETFKITVSYNSPSGLLNYILAIPSKLKGRKRRFETTYIFSPLLLEGGLPPAKYEG